MFNVTTFYKFTKIAPELLEELRAKLIKCGEELSVRGLLLIGTEGCNATVCAAPDNLARFKSYVTALPEIGELLFKDSNSPFQTFRRYKVEIREEIVTLKDKEAVPADHFNNHLEPREWQAVLDSEEDVLLIDTRNFYETEIGMFKGACDLRLNKFSDFPEVIKSLDIPKDKKVLMYCTGGIRCEKAILDMQKQGFTNVFQLQGGILKYLEELPQKDFEGECFVFDHRVAVDQNLLPSKTYTFCPHCGNPAAVNISCNLCSKEKKVCAACLAKADELRSCSKNCAYHLAIKLKKEKAQEAA